MMTSDLRGSVSSTVDDASGEYTPGASSHVKFNAYDLYGLVHGYHDRCIR